VSVRLRDVVVTGASTELPDAGFDPAARLRRRALRYKDRATKLGLCAAQAGLEHAGLVMDAGLTVPPESVGVVVSSNLGNVDTVCGVVETIAATTVTGTSPMDLPNASSNVISSSIAIWFGLRGMNLTLCNGATSGLDAVHWAAILVAAGRARRVLVVGVETANPVAERLCHGVRDAMAALVVESAAAASQRGARPLAAIASGARRPGLPEAVARAAAAAGWPRLGAWFVPEGCAKRVAGADDLRGVPAHDLAADGVRSGALGAFQCAAGVCWLAGGGEGAVLATAGGPLDDAGTALILTAPGDSG
jgi:3-oxoacyl-[acyl-carrier-protein] synthase II